MAIRGAQDVCPRYQDAGFQPTSNTRDLHPRDPMRRVTASHTARIMQRSLQGRKNRRIMPRTGLPGPPRRLNPKKTYQLHSNPTNTLLQSQLTNQPNTMTVHGYPQLAQFLHLDPSFWIFRRFAALNAKNLLYMQAELVNLERELADLEEESCKSGIGAAAQYRVFELKNEMADANVRKQWEKVMEVRGVLREYSRFFELRLRAVFVMYIARCVSTCWRPPCPFSCVIYTGQVISPSCWPLSHIFELQYLCYISRALYLN